jgi:hypothetical protein
MFYKSLLLAVLVGTGLCNAQATIKDAAASFYLAGSSPEHLKDPEIQRQLKELADSKEVQTFNKLHKGIDQNNIQMVKEALAEGIPLNGEGGQYLMHCGIRVLPLFLAAVRGRVEIVELLLKHDADPCAAYGFLIDIDNPFHNNVGEKEYLRTPSMVSLEKIDTYIQTPGTLCATNNETGQRYIFFRGFTAFHGACINPKEMIGIEEDISEETKLKIIQKLWQAEQKTHTNQKIGNTAENKHCRIVSYDPFERIEGNVANDSPEMASDLAKVHGYNKLAEVMDKLEAGQEVNFDLYSARKGIIASFCAAIKKLVTK